MRGLRIGRALCAAVVVALSAPQARRAGAAEAPVAVDAAIVLAADVSRSIDDDEFALERRGYADAIQSQQLLDAISTGPHGAIALAYVEWAGDGEEQGGGRLGGDPQPRRRARVRRRADCGAALVRRTDRHRLGDRFLVRAVRRERASKPTAG